MPHRIHPIDIHIGKRVTIRRAELEIMIESLSLISGISIADLLRLEAGKLKVTAAQVFYLSHALQVPISYFFEQHDEEKTMEIQRLILAFLSITKDHARDAIIRLAEDNAANPQS